MKRVSENFERKSHASQVSMSDEWFEYANEDHFWMKWRFSVLKKILKEIDLIGKPLLEIGCGNGIFKEQMEREGYVVDGCDLNVNALKLAKRGKGRLFLYNIFDKSPEFMFKYECIFLLDVIEHIKDDNLFVKTAMEHTSNDAYIVINVPAYNYLFSKYDVEAGHIRRYNKKEVKVLFADCNISLYYIGYWGIFLIPIALLRKLYLSLFSRNIIKNGFKPPNKFVHVILKCLMYMELSLPSLRFAGTSLVAIGKIKKISSKNEEAINK